MIAATTFSLLSTGPAFAVPGAGPDGGRTAGITSVSCPSAGNCGAVGYLDPPGQNETFVINETNGTWGKARPVAGMAALPKGGAVEGRLNWVSCPSAGNCAAGGTYLDHAKVWRAFVVTETNGTWGKAKQVPGLATLKPGQRVTMSSVDHVDCSSVGNCAASGGFTSTSLSESTFVVTESNGVWGHAEELPGIAALNLGGFADLDSISCPSAGNCAGAGFYIDKNASEQAFVDAEKNGIWAKAQEDPGSAAANTGKIARTQSVSCSSPGNCLAVGEYLAPGGFHAFSITMTGGVWGQIEKVPGLASLVTGRLTYAESTWVWCASTGNCTALGTYADQSFKFHNFVITQTNGRWGNPEKVPLGARPSAFIGSMSCTSIGNCSAGGGFGGRGSNEALVITETNGVWGTAREVPGSVALNRGGAATVSSVSCGAPGDCVAGGYYSPKWPVHEPFIVTETGRVWGNAKEVPGLP